MTRWAVLVSQFHQHLMSCFFGRYYFAKKKSIHKLKVQKGCVKKLWHEEAASEKLVKLSPSVNLINVKRANFSYKCCILAAFSSYIYIKKRCLYEKFVHKMLMKLTPNWQYENIATSAIFWVIESSIDDLEWKFVDTS